MKTRSTCRTTRRGRTAIGKALLPAMLTVCVLSGATAVSHAAVPAPVGRGYERISPAEKGTAVVDITNGVIGAADEGDAVGWRLLGAIGDPLSYHIYSTFRAQRTAGGWQSTQVAPALPAVPEPGGTKEMIVVAFSDDGQRALALSLLPLEPRDHDSESDLYRIDLATGASTLISAAPSGDDAVAVAPTLTRAAGDLSWVVFSMAAPLIPGAPAGGGVYKWADGELTLLSRASDGTPAPTAAASATGSQRSGSAASSTYPVVAHGGAHAVSDDGTVVFWKSPDNGFAKLFARIGGAQTVAYSTSQRTLAGGVPAGTQPTGAFFIAATHDGSTVYFSSASQLTDAATPGGGIYRYTFADGMLEQVTSASQGGADIAVSDAIASDDGSHVYFVTPAALTAGANAGKPNAYVWSADGGTRLIAAFSSFGDSPLAARVSRDGRFAVFSTTGSVAGAQTGGNTELYRYDASASKLTCGSCRASGAASGAAGRLAAAGDGRNLTDGGELYFTTPDPLVDGDINGQDDVYGFDGERPFLISSGRGEGGIYGDNTDDGSNIYFITSDGLVDDDVDGAPDVYTARRGGGFPPQQPDPQVRCSGIDCAAPASPAPNFPLPQSEVLVGSGNLLDHPTKRAIKPSLTVSRIGTAATKRFARSGRTGLSVRTSTAATVTATVNMRVGSHWVRANRAVRALHSGGHVTLRLSLSAKARRILAARRSLRVRLEVRSSRTRGAWTQTLVLRSTHASRGGGR